MTVISPLEKPKALRRAYPAFVKAKLVGCVRSGAPSATREVVRDTARLALSRETGLHPDLDSGARAH